MNEQEVPCSEHLLQDFMDSLVRRCRLGGRKGRRERRGSDFDLGVLYRVKLRHWANLALHPCTVRPVKFSNSID